MDCFECDSTHTTLQDLRQLLADRLLERVRNHFQHVGGGQIGERDLETVPEVPQAELPAAAEVLTSLPAGGSPAVPSPATPATGAVRPTPRSSLRKPPTGSSPVDSTGCLLCMLQRDTPDCHDSLPAKMIASTRLSVVKAQA